MHREFPSGIIAAAPPKKQEDGDNGATEASGYNPQLEPAPYCKFGAAPPQTASSAEDAKDTKGAKEGEETGASDYKPQLESVDYGKFGAAPPNKPAEAGGEGDCNTGHLSGGAWDSPKKAEEQEAPAEGKEASGYKPQDGQAPHFGVGDDRSTTIIEAGEERDEEAEDAAEAKKAEGNEAPHGRCSHGWTIVSAEEANDPQGAIEPQEHKQVVTKSVTWLFWRNWNMFK